MPQPGILAQSTPCAAVLLDPELAEGRQLECLCTGPRQQRGVLTKLTFSTMIHPHLQQCELGPVRNRVIQSPRPTKNTGGTTNPLPGTRSMAITLSAGSPKLHQMPGLVIHGPRTMLKLVRLRSSGTTQQILIPMPSAK